MNDICAVQEESKIQFGSVAEAVAWAERVTLRDGVGSWLGAYSGRRGDDKDPGPSGRISAGEAKDVAHSITCAISRVDPHVAGQLYRCLYGTKDMRRHAIVSRELGHEIRSAVQFGPQTSATKVDAFAVAMIGAEREKRRYGRRTPAGEIARKMGMGRTALHANPWAEARAESAGVMQRWIDIAERRLGDLLVDMGVL